MNYQVLARKWRPQNFAAVVGQQHVLQALSNALTHQRLHHAYLLTGTRGVGKTTIARILAKSLNCEQGITATPCGECDTCREIDEGRYVDLLEIDAASRTKVEDTRELLDNVQYRPTRGRYKVYLIDEVHMLSRHSFNALLKTLEEPPEHVKFLLATTDPEKLPVTVLSRCLQFHLRALTRDEIVGQLDHILQAEQVAFDGQSLQLLARAARGSMRDALSLTDQAIAQGNQAIELESVQRMLGHIEGRRVVQMLTQIINGEMQAALKSLRAMQDKVPDIAVVLPELQNLLHQLALFQVSPQLADSDLFGDSTALKPLAQGMAPELVQVYYRMVLEGRRELPHSVDAFSAVEMTLLRMLAFRPADMQAITASEFTAEVATENSAPEPDERDDDEAVDDLNQAQDEILAQAQMIRHDPQPGHDPDAPTEQPEPEPQGEPEPEPYPAPPAEPQPNPDTQDGLAGLMATREALLAKKKAPGAVANPRYAAEVDAWSASVDGLQAHGRLRQVLLHSVLESQGEGFHLLVDEQQRVLCSDAILQEMEQMLRTLVGEVPLSIEYGAPTQTPFMIQQALDSERQAQALQTVRNDARLQALCTRFDATLDESSVKPVV
jgi:DNA polymerase-3 subunit gamma/tau